MLITTSLPRGDSATLARTAWLVVLLLCPVALLNYLDRQMLAAMKFSVMTDIPSISTEANWGYMLAQFKWVYAGLSPIGGYIADRFSRRYVICGSLFAWSAITYATGHVTTYEGLLWTRTAMGISEAFYIPAALAMIADYHTGKTRSLAVGTHQVAIYLGVIVGGASGYVAESPAYGWRFMFTLTGLAGVVYAIPLLLLLRDRTRRSADPVARHPVARHSNVESSATAEPDAKAPILSYESLLTQSIVDSRPSPWGALTQFLTNGSFILLVLYFTLPALAGWVVRDWMPVILKERFKIGQGQAGVSATLYWQLGAIVGVAIGGLLADRLVRKNLRGRIWISAIGMTLIVPALFGVGNASTLLMAVFFLCVFGVGWGFFDCNNMPILAQITRPHLRATGYGLMNLVSIGCGGLADWGFGMLRDHQVPVNIIFTVFASVAVVSVGLVLLIRPRPEAELVA